MQLQRESTPKLTWMLVEGGEVLKEDVRWMLSMWTTGCSTILTMLILTMVLVAEVEALEDEMGVDDLAVEAGLG